eukprot:SAG11_NODE_10083_length_857_cov_1.220317_1_plen_98_part_10
MPLVGEMTPQNFEMQYRPNLPLVVVGGAEYIPRAPTLLQAVFEADPGTSDVLIVRGCRRVSPRWTGLARANALPNFGGSAWSPSRECTLVLRRIVLSL